MKRWLVLLLLISIGLNVGLALRARQDPPDRRRHGPPHDWPAAGDSLAWRERIEQRTRRLGDWLGLDERQREDFRRRHAGSLREIGRRRGEVEARRREIHDLMRAETLDPEAVRRAVGAHARAQARMDSLLAERMIAELAVLTPEQRLMMLERLHWDGDRPHGPFGRGHGHGRHRQGPGRGGPGP